MTAQAIFAAGCFWGVEAAFRKLDGVVETAVGYIGGQSSNPSYEEVCTGETGHAEAVRIDFDPAKLSFENLLNVFWRIHDPTQRDRQGPDVGSQYRSAVFYLDADQERVARASLETLETSGHFGRPIVTEIVPATDFWMAEDYHQQYLEKRKQAPGWF